MANNINQSKWAYHLCGCARVANDIAKILDIREDSARQANFATVVISATQHHIFVEPVPEDSKTPVIQPEPAAVESRVPEKGVDADKAAAETNEERDEAAAIRADGQIADMPRNPTPEIADGGRRTAFLKGVNSARELLNKEGHNPPVTPAGLNKFIAKEFPGKTSLDGLDTDELERLVILLGSKLEVLREKNNKAKAAEPLDFP